MRVVVSTIGTPCYGILNYLVKTIQPVLNENPIRLKNSKDFINKIKSWLIDKDKIQVSFDIVNLYPSIPLKEATLILFDQLNKSVSYKNSTKLTLTETKQLIELCLFRCYFLWNGEIHELENSGPIGLSFMVVLAESYLQYHEEKAIKMATTMIPLIDIKSFPRYVDNSHARQHLSLKYTIEVENKNKILNFLDITIINNTQGKYEFKVDRKDAIINIQIKPHSNHDPKILKAIFKEYIHRAYSICSENHLKDEINFLIQVFTENGYDEIMLKDISNQVRKKRFANKNVIPSNSNNLSTISLPWIPIISPRLRRIFRKAGYRTVFKSNANLKTLLTSKNKSKLPCNSTPETYLIKC
ncbi:uncharacterized protein LOC124807001 [Hydra vulgaris]|uniref:uncharacterized protein LOC124807001 n=1 Tax=Hydra vulgaris TaxID=6087 RepID=UPI001F5E8C15|nr:uncharacterized protein LOC124807001 [Hydra vulgaris]